MTDETVRTGFADPDDWAFWELVLNDPELVALELPQGPVAAC